MKQPIKLMFVALLIGSIFIILSDHTLIRLFTQSSFETLERIPLLEPMPVLPSYSYEFPYNKTCEFEYNAVPPVNATHKYRVSLYYHVGVIGNWIHVIHDQLDTLERCGLGYIAKELTISVNTQAPDSVFEQLASILHQYTFTHSLQNITFLRSAYPETYEWTIMQEMRNYCLEKINSSTQHIFYYFHTKGVGRFETTWQPKGEDLYYKSLLWRKYMEFFHMERPTLCLRAFLYHGAKACGVHAQGWPTLHYSGNFWSTTCDWITHLDNNKPEGPIKTYVGAEMWIGNQSNGEVTNASKFLNLFDFPVVLLSEAPIYPHDYQNITWNRSMWPTTQVAIWEDYLHGLNGIHKKKRKVWS